jgi:maltose alpha-D-glucosyltransferase / alpha-amylase
VLCLNNLAATPQATTVSLPDHAGARLSDVFGGSGFPHVPADGALPVMLGSRDFLWLRVETDK